MKKKIKIAIIICSICCFNVTNIDAQEEVMSSRETNENLEEMFEYAKSNQTLLIDENIITDSVIKNDRNTYETEIYEYTPESYDYGNIHSRTYLAAARTIGLSKTSEGYDNSYSYYGYLRAVYNDTINSNNEKQYLLTNVRVSWQQKDTSVSISERTLIYACTYKLDSSQRKEISLGGNAYSKATGFTKYAIDDGVSTAVGAHASAKLTHGSSYTFEMNANVCVRTAASWW